MRVGEENMELNNNITKDESPIQEIKREVETLKSIILGIEKEFKQKGKYKVESHQYDREGGLFFNPEKYAVKTASNIHQQIKNILSILKKRFPWIYFKDFNIIDYSKTDKDHRYINFLGLITFLEAHVKVKSPFSEDLITRVYRSVSFNEKWKEQIYSSLESLISLCEKLNKPEVIKELDKPVLIALTQILHNPIKKFTLNDFRFIKSEILEAAISYGEKNKYIKPINSKMYQIINEDVFEILCPNFNCKKNISSYLDECPYCGFYILNLVLKNRRQMLYYIPKNWFKYEGNIYSAYFYYSKSISKIKLSETVEIDPDVLVLFPVVASLETYKYIYRIPDILFHSDWYTSYLPYSILSLKTYNDYYVIKTNNIDETNKKLYKILEEIKIKAEEVYYSWIEFVKNRKEDLWINKDEFIHRILLICNESFKPPLNKHPIQEVNIKEIITTDYIKNITKMNLKDYTILDLIGKGGFSEVYRVKKETDGKIYALKFPHFNIFQTMDSKQVESFLKEIEVWKSLDHPTIVKIIDYGFKGVPHLVMEYLEGGSLRDKLTKGINWNSAIIIFSEVSDALQYAHRQGIIHRDIKPENILFTKDGKIKVADWGLAKVLFAVSSKSSAEFKGTLVYSAPEQISPEDYGDIDQRTDIYQCGCLLYEMLTKRPPFTADNPLQLINNILNKMPEKPSELNKMLPPIVNNIILKALEKRKEKRFQNVLDFKIQLETALKKT